MKLAASQIGWAAEDAPAALGLLRDCGYQGLEIAPSIAVGPQPYTRLSQAGAYAAQVQREYGLSLCSMQSIWYGRSGSIFGPEREALLRYTYEAIDFAKAAGVPNLVFGCPRNRVFPAGADETGADGFFGAVAERAEQNGTVLALEPNPEIYGTNFMNTTPQGLAVVKRINRPGCKLNLDFGAMVQNSEPVELLRGNVGYIHHVHISEPNLTPIQPHKRHAQLAALLKEEGYEGYVSIEMRAVSLEELAKAVEYVAEVFG